MKHLKWLFTSLVITACMGGCATKVITPEVSPSQLSIQINSSKNLNPDYFNHASPLYLTIYQLSDFNNFNTANYMQLQLSANTALADDLIDRKLIFINPGFHKLISITVDPKTQYIGVIASYSEPNISTWRVIQKINIRQQELVINLNKLNMTMGDK